MKRSAEERTSGIKGHHWEDVVLTWDTARQMIVLVSRILKDILQGNERRAQLAVEQEHLDEHRLSLPWRERARRYEIQDEIANLDRTVSESRDELDRLGIAILDESTGEAGFPTLVNDRRAFFTWRPTEENLEFWQFEGEPVRRPVPASWTKPVENGAGGRR
jgi:hypothetical protein